KPSSNLSEDNSFNMKKTIGLVFGGRSGEHEISIRSAKAVYPQFDPERYEVVPVAITTSGEWLNPLESATLLQDSVKEETLEALKKYEGSTIGLYGDPGSKGLTIKKADSVETIKIDVFFPVLHGT